MFYEKLLMKGSRRTSVDRVTHRVILFDLTPTPTSSWMALHRKTLKAHIY
jgi:hypothetical protein